MFGSQPVEEVGVALVMYLVGSAPSEMVGPGAQKSLYSRAAVETAAWKYVDFCPPVSPSVVLGGSAPSEMTGEAGVQ